MTCCCVTPPPDPPPVGTCCFTEISTTLQRTGAARQNQQNPYNILRAANFWVDPVRSLDLGIAELESYLQGGDDKFFDYDVNGDGFITNNDLLILINFKNFITDNSSSAGNVCVDNITQVQCFANFGIGTASGPLTDKEKLADNLPETLFNRYNHRFKANESCGQQISCPNFPSISYNTACGEVDCPGFYCNVITGECGLRSSIDSSLLGSYPYTLVDNCNECKKQNPGCCCYYWEDPEGEIPDYNNVFYVADDSLCNAGRIFHINQFIFPTSNFVSESNGGFTRDSNGNISCGSISPCNEDDDDDDDDVSASGWYCLEQFNSGNKFCQFFNRHPKEEGFIDTEVKGGPFQEKSICDDNCAGGDEDPPHPPADQGYICLSMDKNGLSDIVLTNNCNVDPFTIEVLVHRYKYDKTGKAGPVSIDVIALRENIQILSGTVNFPTPDIVNEEFTQTIPFTLTLPRDFSTGEHPLFVQLKDPTNGAKIGSFTCRLKIKVVIPDDCPFCCKDDVVIGTDISPCDCFALGGECSNTNDCGTPRDDLGRCCYGPSGCNPPCPESQICEDGITKRECDEKIFSINGVTFPTIRDFSKGENCDSDPCYTTTTTTTTPSPCTCAEAGKIDCQENINEDGCIFLYNESTDSFSLTSDCPDGASCLDYDVDCFRTPALSDGDLFGKPCCCTTPPPLSSSCDYCCVDPDGEGSTTLTSAECAALKGVCINSGDLPSFLSSSPFKDVAKSYCNTNSCDPITGYLVRYEASGVHTPNSQSYTIPSSGNVNFYFYSGLKHKQKLQNFGVYDSGNCPIKITLKKNGVTVYESPYFGDPSYQSELDAALGSSNPISGWRGGFRSGIFFDEVGTLGVDISSPLDCGEKSSWSYAATCPYSCVNNIINADDPDGNFSIVVPFDDFESAFERRFAILLNSDNFLDFNEYPNLGYDPARLFDFDINTSIYAYIFESGIKHGVYVENYHANVTLGQLPAPGISDCSKGFNYYWSDSVPTASYGKWYLGTPQLSLDNVMQTVSFSAEFVDGTFLTVSERNIHDSIDTFTSNDCNDNALAVSLCDRSNIILDVEDLNDIPWQKFAIGCSQADITLEVKQEGDICSRRYTVNSGIQTNPCKVKNNNFKIGCITVHSQDENNQSMPPNFDWQPLESGTLTIDKLEDDSAEGCPCFGSMCCDAKTVDSDCYKNVSETSCDCLIGPGLVNPTLGEIFGDPCNSIFYRHGFVPGRIGERIPYSHFNRLGVSLALGVPCGARAGKCDGSSVPVENMITPTLDDYPDTAPPGYWTYPSCDEIKKLCLGEQDEGDGL